MHRKIRIFKYYKEIRVNYPLIIDILMIKENYWGIQIIIQIRVDKD